MCFLSLVLTQATVWGGKRFAYDGFLIVYGENCLGEACSGSFVFWVFFWSRFFGVTRIDLMGL